MEEALATMLDIIKSVNDSMHQIAITGFEVSIRYNDPLSVSVGELQCYSSTTSLLTTVVVIELIVHYCLKQSDIVV